ncbi:MAG: hypothetical protein H6635_15310 [Anaerolineales bacterium]|nr:hypothetical protein [Anaerolineales bacterium]MCB9146733.1 hypothetical protein [Anaerolineales bacterium]
MINGWMGTVLAGFQAINQILTAGIAITAFSLFLYSLSFNLRDRVARSFALILLCIVIIFTAESLQDNTVTIQTLDLLMRLQWFGLVFLPAAYLHLSDALLVTAGRPSRGRRRIAVRGMYILSSLFLALLAFGLLLGQIVPDGKPAPYLQRTVWTEVFTVFYVIAMVWAGINFYRAYSRMLTRSGRRRMIYLMAGATAPALGSYPYLLFGYALAAQHELLFWSAATIINVLVGALVVMMAYAVAFFGVSWPDRVIKSRLFKWIMRGPVTASVTLGLMTVVRRGGELLGTPYSAFVPFTVVASVLLMEHAITFAAPLWERWLFYGQDRGELEFLQNVEERLLTQGDLQQFLESVLAAVRDHLQASAAFVAALDDETLLPVIAAGNRTIMEDENLSDVLHQVSGDQRREFLWGSYWVLPLYSRRRPEMDRDENPPLLGILGVTKNDTKAEMESDQRDALWLLADRAALALEDRQLQQRVFRSLADIQPQVEMIQRMRAASRYDTNVNLLSVPLPQEADLATWVKDALTHYWGGPKLTNSPLARLQVVRELADQEDGNIPNALRALLRRAVDAVKPSGDRKFTTEWILYNILEMKFIEGHKVREVAARLAMSEADLYRKQRVAIEAVAKAILEMEVSQLEQ